ncbi:Emp24/gp25L/p24 family protein [Cooperia oncophora]
MSLSRQFLWRTVEHGEMIPADDIWSDYGITKPPPSKTFSLKSQSTCEIVRTCNQAGRLIWNFTINGDVEFEIVRRDAGKEVKIWPKITLTSLKLPEYGNVTVIPGAYVVRFKNPSTTWFTVKVTGTAEIIAEDK